MKNCGIFLLLLLSGCASSATREQLFEYKQSEYSKLLEFAKGFAKRNSLRVMREEPPLLVEVDEEYLYSAKKLSKRPMHTIAGCCDISNKKIYVIDKKDKETLYHEYGHWFFYDSNRNNSDLEERIADKFSEEYLKCLK